MARLRVKDGSLLQQANFANALKDPWRRVVYQPKNGGKLQVSLWVTCNTVGKTKKKNISSLK